jgi:hypothetical protein
MHFMLWYCYIYYYVLWIEASDNLSTSILALGVKTRQLRHCLKVPATCLISLPSSLRHPTSSYDLRWRSPFDPAAMKIEPTALLTSYLHLPLSELPAGHPLQVMILPLFFLPAARWVILQRNLVRVTDS